MAPAIAVMKRNPACTMTFASHRPRSLMVSGRASHQPVREKMENQFSNSERPWNRRMAGLAAAAVVLLATAPQASAQEQILFPATDNAVQPLIQKIRDEQVRIDVGVWLLGEHELSINLVNKHLAGVPVRILGDRASIFEGNGETRREFEFLANAGVPIRLRYHPTFFPEIIHWKAGIFVGQNIVEFGSANWTTFELAPVSSTNFKDETAMFTNDSAIVDAFKTEFDRMWADTTFFKDWPEAYQLETGQAWTAPMNVDRTRLEPERDTNIPGMVWSQGTALIDAMTAEVLRETQAIDIVIYRLSVPKLADALIKQHQAGVPVRVMVEPTQYRNIAFPEYWLTGAQVDRLWAAGIPVRQRTHEGLMHMKTLITSSVAMNGSSNFTKNWERDHNYFISAQTKPAIYLAVKDRFNAMWNDAVNYAAFAPQDPASIDVTGPPLGAVVSTSPTLQWNRAPWVVFYDVMIGPSPQAMTLSARVNAALSEEPPEGYSHTPGPLQPGTTYYWQVVGRTFASDNDPGVASFSEVRAFTTDSGGGSGSGPFTGTPVALPGTIEAEHFDNGPAGVAYVDTTSGNSGGAYRNTDVDIEATGDAGGGHNVGWIAPNERLKYSVSVTTAGTYSIEFRVAAAGGGGTFHLEVDGVDKTGPLSIPDTGGWQSWTTVTKTGVALVAGPQAWTLVFDSIGGSGAVGNVNSVRVTTSSGGGNPGTSTPFGGTPAALPGTIQAEAFDDGGTGIAYSDTTAGNSGGQFRTTDVDIEGTADTGGGFNVGWAFAGEWWKYSTTVASAGSYDIEVRVASSGGGGTFHIEVDGVDKTGPMTVPDTGGWQTWSTITKTGVSLNAGAQLWRLVMDSNGPSTAVGNINFIRVNPSGSPPPPPPAASEIVIYGADVAASALVGNWSRVNDSTAAAGIKLASADLAVGTVATPQATPVNYFDVTFNAQAGVRYRVWLRMTAANADKFNDSVYLQFSESVNAASAPIYRIGTTQGLNVNMATCSDCPLPGWGWQNHAYWEPDTGDVRFATTGGQTIRVQIREDGVAVDQIVLSPVTYVNNPPGPPANDSTIVIKP
jgi:phosphatidylserine/phosphatidylglycerophosphate/cardiolipin synthase-like enzyme